MDFLGFYFVFFINYVKINYMDDKNLHAGHRERLILRFLTNPDGFADHELLELLLFYAIPRKNTNDLAHKLLSSFGSLENVFNADKDRLIAVDGIGEKVATQIMVVGKLCDLINSRKSEPVYCINAEDVKNYFTKEFANCKTEIFILCFLDKKYRITNKMTFNNGHSRHVFADFSDIASIIAVQKPKFILLAHNHPSGNILPSEDDDFATMQVNTLCDLHGAQLLDHVIFGNNFYSYRDTGRLDRIKNKSDISNIFKHIKEN